MPSLLILECGYIKHTTTKNLCFTGAVFTWTLTENDIHLTLVSKRAWRDFTCNFGVFFCNLDIHIHSQIDMIMTFHRMFAYPYFSKWITCVDFLHYLFLVHAEVVGMMDLVAEYLFCLVGLCAIPLFCRLRRTSPSLLLLHTRRQRVVISCARVSWGHAPRAQQHQFLVMDVLSFGSIVSLLPRLKSCLGQRQRAQDRDPRAHEHEASLSSHAPPGVRPPRRGRNPPKTLMARSLPRRQTDAN